MIGPFEILPHKFVSSLTGEFKVSFTCPYSTLTRQCKQAPGILQPCPEAIKLFSCSIQLSMKFVQLINLKLLTIVNSFLLNIAEHENFSANKYENANYCWHFHIY